MFSKDLYCRHVKTRACLGNGQACEKSSRWLWKEGCVSTGVRKPGNTCVTDRHDMTLAVKEALNPNTTNKPTEEQTPGKFEWPLTYHPPVLPV